jgi:hypothetical protein
VHHLEAYVSGAQLASQEEVDQWIEWLEVKLLPNKENFNSVKDKFKQAGLLEEGGLGDGEAGVRAKFLQAEEVIEHVTKDYNLFSAPKLVKRQRSAWEEEKGASRAQPPPKRARTHVRDNPSPAYSPAPQEGGAAGGHPQFAAQQQGLSPPQPRDNEEAEGWPDEQSSTKDSATLALHGFAHSSDQASEWGSSSQWDPFSDWASPDSHISSVLHVPWTERGSGFAYVQDSVAHPEGSALVLMLLYLASSHYSTSSVLILLYI